MSRRPTPPRDADELLAAFTELTSRSAPPRRVEPRRSRYIVGGLASVVAAVVLVALVGALVVSRVLPQAAVPSTPLPTPTGVAVPVPTSPQESQGVACYPNVLTGALLAGSPADPQIAWVVSTNGQRVDVMWPIGFTARFVPELELHASWGLVGRAGDEVALFGGFDSGGRFDACGGVQSGPVNIGGDPLPWPAASPSPVAETPPSTPDGAVVEFTNPDGPDPADYAPDNHPFIESARALPTFGQLWIDDNQRDFHIALTGDVDGAIEALGDDVPRGVTVYFHIVRYSEAELCALRDAMFADREELMRRGIVLSSGACGSIGNRVTVGLSPLTPEVLAYMTSRYDGPIDYEPSGSSALLPYQPPETDQVRLIAVRDGDDAGLLTCGRRPFPAAAIARPASDISTAGEEFLTLRESLTIYVDVYGDLSRLSWILAEQDGYGATFLAERGDTWLEAPVFAGRDGWVPGTIDYCSPRPLTADDGGSASVYLNPSFPTPGPEATEIHVLVEEEACAGGTSPAGRLLPPTVRSTESHVTVEVRVRGVGGPAECPSNPRLPVTIELPEPLGDRVLRGVSPPPER